VCQEFVEALKRFFDYANLHSDSAL